MPPPPHPPGSEPTTEHPALPLPLPHNRGVSQLFIGWGTSPVMAMLASGILFFLIRTFIMRSSQAYQVWTGWAWSPQAGRHCVPQLGRLAAPCAAP